MIDVFIAVFVIAALIALIKWGGAILSFIHAKIRSWYYSQKYPIESEMFPIKALRFGDMLEINGVGICKFQGKLNGKYYIEAVKGTPFDGKAYLYANRDYIISNSTMLSNDKVEKWRKS